MNRVEECSIHSAAQIALTLTNPVASVDSVERCDREAADPGVTGSTTDSAPSADRERHSQSARAIPEPVRPEGVVCECDPQPGCGASPGSVLSKAVCTRRVLVIDDNRPSADALGELVRIWGHDSQIAYDGPEGIELALAYVPHVVLVDIGLPTLDGYVVASRLRQHAELAGVVLIAISGFDLTQESEHCRKAGFDQALVKPIDLKRLEQFLSSS